MCGILLHVDLGPRTSGQTEDAEGLPGWWASGVEEIRARGPDCHSQSSQTFPGTTCRLAIAGSVLALRGDATVAQPMRSSDDSLIFLWNGEVFESSGSAFDLDQHDGKQLLQMIEDKLAGEQAHLSRCQAFASILAAVEGPFATALVDVRYGRIYFARDPLGRRSLLVSRQQGDSLTITSTRASGMDMSFEEVDCGSIWDLSLKDLQMNAISRPSYVETKPLLDESAEEEATLKRFEDVLSESVRLRVQHIRRRSEPQQSVDGEEAQLAILFSGGLDCSTLALLAHRHLPAHHAIDLLNVAFQNPRVLASSAKSSQDAYDVPDRRTGRSTLEELRTVAPERTWRLVEVNVPHATYVQHRSRIETLMAPCTSVMDLSIAAALYFASGGDASSLQSSRARVLLSGLGADELLGGYSRHRKAFQLSGQTGLEQELEMDLMRLPSRNLGRDDRIISSNGKECRYPFLDRNVIQFLVRQPVHVKMNLALAPGTGDKMLLRRLAHRLGLSQTSLLAKRAIQFGARSAKMDVGDGRIKGHERLQPIESV